MGTSLCCSGPRNWGASVRSGSLIERAGMGRTERSRAIMSTSREVTVSLCTVKELSLEPLLPAVSP